MARKLSEKTKPLRDFAAAIGEALQEIADETYAAIDSGLDKSMEYLKGELVAASPVESGLTSESWEGTDKYKNVRYINNSRVNEKGIPVVNLLEYGSKGKPFVRATVDREQEKVIQIIKGEVEHDTK